MKSTRDSQRKACYDWETKIEKEFPQMAKSLTLDECKELIQRVWNDYRPGSEFPKIKDGRGTRRAKGGRWSINLPRWARKPSIVLHETAHSLQTTQPWHGPEFARLVLELWVRYYGLPRLRAKSLGVHQKPRRVRFASLAASVRKPRQKWIEWKERKEKVLMVWKKLRDNEPPKY